MSLPQAVFNPGPIGYLDMQAALFHGDGVLTDSGGLQKEAWFQGNGAVVLRDTTEWRELLSIGASTLFDPALLRAPQGRSALVDRLVSPSEVPEVEGSGLFGEGKAAARILGALQSRR
jgi:UDP-GlcNAc3NAcA epimerase